MFPLLSKKDWMQGDLYDPKNAFAIEKSTNTEIGTPGSCP
jgi:hypothetical protein